MIFTAEGQVALIQMRGDLPRIAANNRDQDTPEENEATVSGSSAYLGTCAVQDGGKLILLKLDGSTYANLMGGERRRIVTRLDADELAFTNPRNAAGMTGEVTRRRAR